MKKILPLNFDIINQRNCYDFYRLSAILTDEKYLPWYVERFIILSMDEYYENQYYDLSNLDLHFLYDEVLSFNEIVNKSDIISKVINAINNNKFVLLRCDDYFIERSNFYQKEHFPHGLMICGYDTELNEAYFVDLSFNTSSWCAYPINFLQLESAFYSCINSISDNFETDEYAFLYLKLNEPASTFKVRTDFDREPKLDAIYNSLKICLEGGEFTNRNTPSYIRRYGISIYKAYYEEVLKMLLNEERKKLLDVRRIIRGLKRLKEHKAGLVFRLNYLNEKNLISMDEDLKKDLEELYKIVNMIFSLFGKFVSNSDTKIVIKLDGVLRQAEKLEEEVLTKACNLIYNSIKSRITLK